MFSRVHSLLKIVLISALFLVIGCDSNSTSNFAGSGYGNAGRSSTDWLVPTDQIVDGGVGRDGIPSIDSPRFTVVSKIEFMEPEDRIIGVKYGNHVKGYPVNILDYHEVVNGRIRNLPFCLTYCPLTGTGIAWNREINGTVTTFEAVQDSLPVVMKDQQGNRWDLFGEAVSGPLKGTQLEVITSYNGYWFAFVDFWPKLTIRRP